MLRHIELDSTTKAIVGIASPVAGVITSFQEQVEWHLRIASLLVGLAVGVKSLVAMVRKWRRRWNDEGNRTHSMVCGNGYELKI